LDHLYLHLSQCNMYDLGSWQEGDAQIIMLARRGSPTIKMTMSI